jgi:hypothetical protein
MKNIVAAVLTALIVSQSAKARVYEPVELTPKNCEENGFSIRFLTLKDGLEGGLCSIVIAFDKLPPFLANRHEARLQIQDDHKLIASVTLQPLYNYNIKDSPLGYSIRLSPDCVSHSKLWLIEGIGIHTTSQRSFGIEFSNFKAVEPSDPPNHEKTRAR